MSFIGTYFKYLRGIWFKKSEGFGDTVAKITKTFGIKPCSKCEERRKKFNQLVKYHKGMEKRVRDSHGI